MSDLKELVPAAQYVRMSTEHQQYSLNNQTRAIAGYAKQHGFEVIASFEDPGRSGLSAGRRPGLHHLFATALSDDCPFKAILVYDVSRWGRYQDSDEAAHYEFICKSAGTPVHYCAEAFPNDNQPISLVLKNLKRVMAAEYSSELSNRVLSGMTLLAQMGYKMGSTAPFGFRRMLIGTDSSRNQLLNKGEKKVLSTDRVVLVPGPKSERDVVRRIFKMGWTLPCTEIAKRLNKKGLRNIRGHLWSAENIHCLLTNPIYIGRSIWGRTTQKLRTKPVERTPWLVPLDSAIPIPGGAFIKPDDFAKLQSVLTSRSRRTSNEELIRKGKEILRKGGNLSAKIIKKNHMAEKTIRSHFGSVAEYYDVLGYKHPPVLHYQRERLRETIRLRKKLAYRLVQLWPSSNVEVQQIGVRTAVRLDGCQVHVKTCRYRPSYAGVARQWTSSEIDNGPNELTLLCRLNENNDGPLDFWVYPPYTRVSKRANFRGESERLRNAQRLEYFSEILDFISPIAARYKLPKQDDRRMALAV